MKKRFVVNENASSLWEELENEKSIKIMGGKSNIARCTENQSFNETDSTATDDGAVLWSKNL